MGENKNKNCNAFYPEKELKLREKEILTKKKKNKVDETEKKGQRKSPRTTLLYLN